jgi:SAM-dependent methyltransferase
MTLTKDDRMSGWQVTHAWDDVDLEDKLPKLKKDPREPKWFYKNRSEKYGWLYSEFRHLFNASKKILDVGCDKALLRTYCGSRYTGLDISPEADIKLNLDCGKPLPFKTKSFDMVVCLDTLEHLESFHDTFNELCRVSSKYVIIILPNPAQSIWSYLFNLTNNKDEQYFGKHLKFYGLPLNKPLDRHRWFYSWQEASNFIKVNADRKHLDVTLLKSDLDYKPFHFIKTPLLKVADWINPNLARSQIICILRRM